MLMGNAATALAAGLFRATNRRPWYFEIVVTFSTRIQVRRLFTPVVYICQASKLLGSGDYTDLQST